MRCELKFFTGIWPYIWSLRVICRENQPLSYTIWNLEKIDFHKTWCGCRVRVAKPPCKIFLILVHWLPWYSVSDWGPPFLTDFHLFNISNLSLIYSAENVSEISKFGLNLLDMKVAFSRASRFFSINILKCNYIAFL